MRKKQPSALQKEIEQSAFAIQVMMSNVEDLEVTFDESSITLYWKNLRIDTDCKGLYEALHLIHKLQSLNARFE
jgi:hypothetical protein